MITTRFEAADPACEPTIASHVINKKIGVFLQTPIFILD